MSLSALKGRAETLRSRSGMRRVLTAFAFGLASALAFSPVSLFPVLWISFPALIFLLQGASGMRAAFVIGWSFAFGQFVLGWYWIAASMFVDIGHFWWAVPLAVAGLPAFFAIYYGIAAALARRLGLHGISGALTFALLWFLADYARGHMFTGFPWNLEGYAWTGLLPMLQVTSVVGIYGLTLVTLVTACLPACLVENKKNGRVLVIASLLVLIACAGWGMWRLDSDTGAAVPGVRLRIVQPNVDQAHKWLSSERDRDFQNLLDLSAAPGEKPVTHIVWPETASTFYLAEDAVHRRAIAAAIPAGSLLLTGVIRHGINADGKLLYYNSLVAVDGQAHIVVSYDKAHLVPFGEYIPLRKYLPLRPLVAIGLDFSSGEGPHTLTVPGLPPFSPFICYEAIFSGDVASRTDRPQLLLNVTNDGWYGNTAGPYQHFASARVRAVEEGLPLVRAANTGISGVVDAYGRMTVRLGLGREGFIDADLPAALAPTFFSQHGERTIWTFFILLACGLILARLRIKRT